MSTATICYGDVIKLWTKSAHTESEGGYLGFLEHKNQLLLVVPPTTDSAHFMEAEFIVAPVRGEKQPKTGTPLNYRQPFVLRTSDGSGYSLNNKTQNFNDSVSLQPTAIKGELYVAIEKEGFTSETHVHDGDMNVEMNVVDSNRIRKKYNKPWSHFTKVKSDAPGGFVCCGSKGPTLTFKVIKVAEKTETPQYIKSPVVRRASQELLDPVKADDVSEASVVETPRTSIVGTGALLTGSNAPSRNGSVVLSVPIIPEHEVINTAAESVSSVGEVSSEATELKNTMTTETETTAVEPVVDVTLLEPVVQVKVAEQLPVPSPQVEQQVEPQTQPLLSEPSNVVEQGPVGVDSGLATIELSAIPVDMEDINKSVTVVDKLASQPSEVTVVSALDVHSESRGRTLTEIEVDNSPMSCIGNKFKDGCIIL